MIKKHFNLVEITLAIAVLAVGMSSALLLFTSGANASREAGVENDLAEALNCVYAQIKTQCLKNAPKQDKTINAQYETTTPTQDWSWEFQNPTTTTVSINDLANPSESWKDPKGAETAEKAKLLQYSNENIYLYRNFDAGGGVTFSAVIWVDKDTGDLENAQFPVCYNGKGKDFETYSTLKTLEYLSGNVNVSEKYLLPLKITMKYPADTQLETFTYHVEIFNDIYRVTE